MPASMRIAKRESISISRSTAALPTLSSSVSLSAWALMM